MKACEKKIANCYDKGMVKGPDFYIPPLTGKPEQQRFTIQSVVY